jgi:hypothetical protein
MTFKSLNTSLLQVLEFYFILFDLLFISKILKYFQIFLLVFFIWENSQYYFQNIWLVFHLKELLETCFWEKREENMLFFIYSDYRTHVVSFGPTCLSSLGVRSCKFIFWELDRNISYTTCYKGQTQGLMSP